MYDDESLTEDDFRDIEQAEKGIQEGKPITLEEYKLW
ncbi:MAG: hypothetical protein BWY64_03418 [bacterium ADurb.Bin363]|nr:MAG: hypothetical protein BWY64_03418 [bacterium ADurb.Bin363]